MTNKEKSDLTFYVKYYLEMGKDAYSIIRQMKRLGYKEPTIKKYIKAFSK